MTLGPWDWSDKNFRHFGWEILSQGRLRNPYGPDFAHEIWSLSRAALHVKIPGGFMPSQLKDVKPMVERFWSSHCGPIVWSHFALPTFVSLRVCAHNLSLADLPRQPWRLRSAPSALASQLCHCGFCRPALTTLGQDRSARHSGKSALSACSWRRTATWGGKI